MHNTRAEVIGCIGLVLTLLAIYGAMRLNEVGQHLDRFLKTLDERSKRVD